MIYLYYNSFMDIIFLLYLEVEMKTCCFSGHRIINDDMMFYIQAQLYNSVKNAINEGYTHFISGFARGVDLLAASIVVDFKESLFKEKHITLEAAIPYKGILEKKDSVFQELLCNCDSVSIISEKYFVGCMHKRNLEMIRKSDMLIAIYDGRHSGGTKFTIDNAIKYGLEINIIEI